MRISNSLRVQFYQVSPVPSLNREKGPSHRASRSRLWQIKAAQRSQPHSTQFFGCAAGYLIISPFELLVCCLFLIASCAFLRVKREVRMWPIAFTEQEGETHFMDSFDMNHWPNIPKMQLKSISLSHLHGLFPQTCFWYWKWMVFPYNMCLNL